MAKDTGDRKGPVEAGRTRGTPAPRRRRSDAPQDPIAQADDGVGAVLEPPAQAFAAPPGPADRDAASEPSADEIAQRAYFRYLERGAIGGGDVDDWLEAERELRRRGRVPRHRSG